MKHIQFLIYILADISMLYFLLLILKTGLQSPFNYFFAVLSLLLFLVGRFLDSAFWRRLPGGVKAGLAAVVCAGLVLFIFLEALIISGSVRRTDEDADYVVVLGCRVRGTVPSLSLQYRIAAAVEYLESHPEARAVLTGGQGVGEDITEAQAMYEAMVELGISPDRLLQEDKSTSTKENLENAKQYIDPEKDRVVLVTTGYHMYRGIKIADGAGYRLVEGYSAKNVWYLAPADYIREALAILKNYILGYL